MGSLKAILVVGGNHVAAKDLFTLELLGQQSITNAAFNFKAGGGLHVPKYLKCYGDEQIIARHLRGKMKVCI